MRPELVIYDCDGVLVDTEPIANPVLAAMLTDEGYPIDSHDCAERFTGRPVPETVREVEEELGRSLSADFTERLYRRVIDAFVSEPRVVPGVREAIDALPGRRCVASSSGPGYLREVLGAAGLWRCFERVFSAVEVERGKPAPDLFLHAASSLGVAPGRCLGVGDAPAGVRAAVAAGMPVLGYAGTVSASRLAREGAVAISSMSELAPRVAAL
ncbi:MAG: HAD family phosphatase [Deinococcales bacterium]